MTYIAPQDSSIFTPILIAQGACLGDLCCDVESCLIRLKGEHEERLDLLPLVYISIFILLAELPLSHTLMNPVPLQWPDKLYTKESVVANNQLLQ